MGDGLTSHSVFDDSPGEFHVALCSGLLRDCHHRCDLRLRRNRGRCSGNCENSFLHFPCVVCDLAHRGSHSTIAQGGHGRIRREKNHCCIFAGFFRNPSRWLQYRERRRPGYSARRREDSGRVEEISVRFPRQARDHAPFITSHAGSCTRNPGRRLGGGECVAVGFAGPIRRADILDRGDASRFVQGRQYDADDVGPDGPPVERCSFGLGVGRSSGPCDLFVGSRCDVRLLSARHEVDVSKRLPINFFLVRYELGYFARSPSSVVWTHATEDRRAFREQANGHVGRANRI